MKKDVIYAFIDSQNLNLGTAKDLFDKKGRLIYKGWKLDFRKFRKYLTDKYKVSVAYLFIGFTSKYQPLYNHLSSCGYQLIFKPTVIDNNGKLKGNVDSELVLQCAAIDYANYHKAIIVAGDGDYACLLDFLEKKNKLLKIVIPNQKSESSLLKPYQKYKVFIQQEKSKLEYTQKTSKIPFPSP